MCVRVYRNHYTWEGISIRQYTFTENKAKKTIGEIVKNERIDIIHQINPVEFRSIGNFAKFKIPFICGPVGGAEYMTSSMKNYLSVKDRLIESIRHLANSYHIKKYRLNSQILQCDALIMPSLRETTGSVLLESLEKGKP